MASRKGEKQKAKASKPGDVVLATAVFCDQILEEKPVPPSTVGIVSAIRIYDTLTATVPVARPPDANLPEAVPAVVANCLIILRANNAPLKTVVQVVWSMPDGTKQKIEEREVGFIGKGLSAFHLKAKLAIPLNAEGDHWFDVIVDGRRLTSMPLRFVVERVKAPRLLKA